MRVRFCANRPFTRGWSHGDKHDPAKWPWWKMFSCQIVRLRTVVGPSSGWRLWVYTRSMAYDFDVFCDRRRAV